MGKKRVHFHKRRVSQSKKEAKKIEQEMRDKLDGKVLAITFVVLFDKRMNKLKQSGKSDSTINTYKSLFDLHVKPFLTNKEISKYSEYDLNNLIDELSENGRSNNTINNVISLLKATFNYAKKNGYLSAINPSDSLSYFDTIKREKPYYFTYDEFLKFIEVCKTVEDDPVLWEAIWTTFFELGLRKSELEPLQVKDINFDHMTISINKHIIEGHGEIKIVPGRKNNDGYDAPLSDKLARILRARIEDLKKYDGYSEDAYLFNIDGLFRPAARTTLARHLDKVCEAAGFPKTTVHSLRHCACMNLVELGADVFTIANHIGDTVELVEKVYGGRIKSHRYARDLLNEQNKSNQKEA